MNRYNSVSFQNLNLQIEAVRWRATLVGCQVTVHQHLDGTISLTKVPHLLGRSESAAQSATKSRRDRLWKSRKMKSHNPDVPTSLRIPQTPGDSDFPIARPLLVDYETGHITCYEKRTF